MQKRLYTIDGFHVWDVWSPNLKKDNTLRLTKLVDGPEQNLNLYPSRMWFSGCTFELDPSGLHWFRQISFLTIVTIHSDKVQPKSTFNRLMNEAGKPGKKAANPEKQEAKKIAKMSC